MAKRPLPIVKTCLDKIVGGGQTLGAMPDGRKLFVWGGLPGETVNVQVTRKKSSMAEGVVTEVIEASDKRTSPKDEDSYLSTSPWQIMDYAFENQCKAELIDQAFTLHHVELPEQTAIVHDENEFYYRNKVEFSWYWNFDTEQIDLAFFRRGSKGKIPLEQTSLAKPEINESAQAIRNIIRTKSIEARDLKTLLIRADQQGNTVCQLYVRDENFDSLNSDDAAYLIGNTSIQGIEIIFSDPRSPASRITKRLVDFGETTLHDSILGIDFRYATESFFQVNIPIYELALTEMKQWVPKNNPVLDLYSGVGTIGLTIGGKDCTLVEINEYAVEEMRRNISRLGSSAKAVLAPSEKALEEIKSDKTIIVDPPRAGLHNDVVEKLINEMPERIIYLSCNPVTQARDVALLLAEDNYKVVHQKGYNFFPRTPHIEHLIVLDKASTN